MAKQPVITPTMQINTGRAPSGNNSVGQAVRVDVYFDAATPDVKISMTSVMQNGGFNTIQCLYIDNSLNASSVIITIPGIQQRILVNGFSQSLEPVYISDTACSAPIVVHSETANIPGFPVSIWFSNVPQPFYVKDGLINNVKNVKLLLPVGNVDVNHGYSFTVNLINSMNLYSVPDWQTIFVDNSMGFQHLYVNDLDAGATVAIVNPYTIAQFPSLRVGSSQYRFSAYDLAAAGPQTNFTYGYDVNVLVRSFPGETYFNITGFNGQYTASTQQVLPAGGSFFVYPNFMRKKVSLFAPNAFTGRFNGITRNSAVDAAGNHTLDYDVASTSCIQGELAAGLSITVATVVAQTIQVRDKF